LGWAFDNVLFYATGGVAWTQIKNSASFTWLNTPEYSWAGQGSSNETGVVAGGGFEYRVSQNLSVVAELLWYDFGTTSISAHAPSLGTVTTQFNNQDTLGRRR
jgi:outer membrane immunogenic protein